MHIIGLVEEQPYYLRYSFVHRIGAIKLEGYHPLFVSTSYEKIRDVEEDVGEGQDYRFNFHE